MKDMNEAGWVSIWLFFTPGMPTCNVLDEVFGIDNYDIAIQDFVGDEDWRTVPIRELLSRLSFSVSFIDAVAREADRRGISEARAALAQYDFKYEPAEAVRPTLDDPVFLCAAGYKTV